MTNIGKTEHIHVTSLSYMCHFLHFNMQHYVSEAIVNVAGVLL